MMNYCQSYPLVKGEHSGDEYSVLQDVKKMNLCPLQGKGAEFVAQSIRDFTALNFSIFWPLETTHLAGFSSEARTIIIVIKKKKHHLPLGFWV